MGQPRGHGQLKGETVRIMGIRRNSGTNYFVTLRDTDLDKGHALVDLVGVPGKTEETLPKGDIVDIIDGITLELTDISYTGYKAWIYYDAPRNYQFCWMG